MVAIGLKVQLAVSLQLQRALNNPSRGRRVSSSETYEKKLIYMLFNLKGSSCLALRELCVFRFMTARVRRKTPISFSPTLVSPEVVCEIRLQSSSNTKALSPSLFTLDSDPIKENTVAMCTQALRSGISNPAPEGPIQHTDDQDLQKTTAQTQLCWCILYKFSRFLFT